MQLIDHIRREVKIIVADVDADNVDSLTKGAIERLLEHVKNLVVTDEVLHGGKTAWARKVSPVKMMPGQDPYTQGELGKLFALVSDAADGDPGEMFEPARGEDR
jgi:hypothetical protein